MRALQLHYTSCRRGLRPGSKGFQVRSATKGIDAQEEQEIIRQGAYHLPMGANDRPTRSEIEKTLPRAFRYYRLENGRPAVTLSSYVGVDYSGRTGNFFAHTLVFDGEEPPTWPIELLDWKGWQVALPSKEDTEDPPASLPEIDFSKPPKGGNHSIESLRGFLRQVPERAALLKEMVAAALLQESTSRAVVVRDDAAHGEMWIACIHRVLPLSVAARIGFSTYQYGGRDCAQINATVAGTQFTFDEVERGHQYFVFNIPDGPVSELVGDDAALISSAKRAAGLIVSWLLKSPETLQRFHEFTDQFNCPPDTNQLAKGARLFESIDGIVESPPLGEEEIVPIIQFIKTLVRKDAWPQVLNLLAQSNIDRTRWRHFETFDILAQFCADVARETEAYEFIHIALDVWRQAFEQWVIEQQNHFDQVKELRRVLVDNYGVDVRKLAEHFLDDRFIERIGRHYPSISIQSLVVTFREILYSLMAVDAAPIWKCEEYIHIVNAAIESRQDSVDLLVDMLRELEGDIDGASLAEVVAETCISASGIRGGVAAEEYERRVETVGAVLAKFLQVHDESFNHAVREVLDSSDGHRILLAEWNALLNSARNKVSFYHAYLDKVLDQHEAFRRAHADAVSRSISEVLNRSERASLLLWWFSEERFDLLPDDLVRASIAEANAAVSLDPHRDDEATHEFADHVRLKAEELGFDLAPNRPLLRCLIKEVVEGDFAPSSHLLEPIGKAVRLLGADECEELLQAVVATLVSRSATRFDHAKIIKHLAPDKLDENSRIFWTFYMNTIKRLGQLRRDRSELGEIVPLAAAIDFWVLGVDAHEERVLEDAIYASVYGRLIHAVGKLGEKAEVELFQRMEELLANAAADDSRHWAEFRAEVENRRESQLRNQLRKVLSRVVLGVRKQR